MVEGGWRLHQKEYLGSKVRQRCETRCRTSLPMVEQGRTVSVKKEVRGSAEYIRMLDWIHGEVQALQWLALKTRPDIATITAICAGTQAKNPWEVATWTREIWKYLNGTSGLGMEITPGETKAVVRIAADASFAPGGDRSRTGVVIRVNSSIVYWSSNKQQSCVMSAHEAELNGAVEGTRIGVNIQNIVTEMCKQEAILKLDQDNTGTIASILHEITSWRTRHYASKAAEIRDLIIKRGIVVGHVKGIEIVADPLTKVLPRVKLV